MSQKEVQLHMTSLCYFTEQSVMAGTEFIAVHTKHQETSFFFSEQLAFDLSLTTPFIMKLLLLFIMAADTQLGAKQLAKWELSVTVKRLKHWSEQIHATNTH